MKIIRKAETSKFRWYTISRIEFCTGKKMSEMSILDVGCGSDPISFYADTFDLAEPYTKINPELFTYCGDAKNLTQYINKLWFYDVVYSSHLIEDFNDEEISVILNDWATVVKDGGFLVLLLPNQQRYVRHCEFIKEKPNEHHKNPDFGVDYIFRKIYLSDWWNVYYMMEFWENDEPNDYEYNFMVIARKGDK